MTETDVQTTAQHIVRFAQAVITQRGLLAGWDKLDRGVCKTFGCNYGSWLSEPETGAPDVVTFNIEYGAFFDCTRKTRPTVTASSNIYLKEVCECEGCSEVDTVNVQVGWTGLTDDDANEVMAYIDEHLLLDLTPDFWRLTK
jgi:hypothetical protein